MKSVTVIGGGLAGSEAAWQIANAGIHVDLFEMRPVTMTGAHASGALAELVCSNSLGSTQSNKASGLLKEELKLLGSLLINCAEASMLPAGTALAVDRKLFAEKVTNAITSHPNIQINRQEVKILPKGPVIIATGPLTSKSLANSIQNFTGSESFYFFDAISPTVDATTVNMDIAFRASRYRFDSEEPGDYINCPMNEEQYNHFIDELLNAKTIPLRFFESDLDKGVKTSFFEACLPIEILAKRNPQSLSFGPMRPVGIHNSHTAEKPRAVVQLRREDVAESLYNMVGFQTNLTFPEQERIFRMIPGLERAVFTRHGQMHRNSYINSPVILDATLQTRLRPDLFFAGQIVGVEGYVGNIASGLLAGINISRYVQGKPPLIFPEMSMIGALHHYVSHAESKYFQPMKANFGLLPPIPQLPRSKEERGTFYATRALTELKGFLSENKLTKL
jgi:methylenetetrahydrofolate--tRNA-(uracil-5-)-methyltransferase